MFAASCTEQPGLSGYRYWRLRLTAALNANTWSLSEWQVRVGTVQTSLAAKTLTNLGSAFDVSYPLSCLNNGAVDTANTDIAVVFGTSFDVYVDMGSAISINGYYLAPQAGPANMVSAFEVYASNTAGSGWVLQAAFTGISTGGWATGAYRSFTW